MKLSKNSKPTGPKEKKPLSLNFSFGKTKKTEEINPETFVFVPSLPKVNVIPSSLTEKYEIKGVVRKVALVSVALAAVLGLVWGGSTAYVGTLNTELETIKVRESELVDQVQQLTPYEEYKNAVAAKRTALSEEVSTDINMSDIYTDMYVTAASQQISLDSVSIAQQEEGSTEAGCTNPEPFAEQQNVVGCINFSGKGSDPEGGRYFVNSLLTISEGARYINPFIASVSVSEEETTFDASIFFTNELYTGQYSELQLSLEDLLVNNTPSEGTEGTEGTEVETGEIEEVTFSSMTTLQAQQLVPELAEQDLQIIETASLEACTTGDTTTALGIIESTLISRLPADDENLSGHMEQLTETLTAECGGVE